MPARRSAPTKSSNAKASKATMVKERKKRKEPETATPDAESPPSKKLKVVHASHTSTPGVILSVGEGDVGQLGLGPDVMEKSRVGLVDLPDKCIQVVAGGMHTACLTVKGEIYTFGCNDEGALGRDTSEEDSEMTPAKMTCNMKFIQISAGDSHTAMLTEVGQVYACGTFRDANGPIGLTNSGNHKTAVHIECDKPMVKIASGSDHILALTQEGVIYSAGCAEQGQLGRVAECFSTRGGRKGVAHLLKLQPIHCKRGKGRTKPKFCDIWAGTYVSFAKSTTGDIYAWGLNNYFQLGINDMENKFVPNLVKALAAERDWRCLSGGQHHSLALNKAGEVFAMGRGTYGQLGLGESATDDATEPVKVEVEEPCSLVDASSSVSFTVTDSGKAYAWGMGTSKQLSSGAEDDQFEPAVMGGKQLANRQVLMVSSGGQHTVLLARDRDDTEK